MLSLSPAKLLVVLVIALIVLGPEKLPEVARQIGAMWGDVRRWRGRLESEVRSTFPDLPPTHEVVRAVRSPLTFLDRLADAHESADPAADTGSVDGRPELSKSPVSSPPGIARGDPSHNGTDAEPARNEERVQNADSAATGVVRDEVGVREEGASVGPDDPSMN